MLPTGDLELLHSMRIIITWVLSRLAVELENMPCQYEGYSIQTWVENVYRLFTDRNFAILDKEGKAVGIRPFRMGDDQYGNSQTC